MRMSHKIKLTIEQKQELTKLVNLHPKPYVRERAAAILKRAEGIPAYKIAESGLLLKRCRQTVGIWIKRYKEEGIAGLLNKEGRGRKPAFSPSRR